MLSSPINQADELRAHRKQVLKLERGAVTVAGMAAAAAAASAQCNNSSISAHGGGGGGGSGGGGPGKRGLAMEELFRQRY